MAMFAAIHTIGTLSLLFQLVVTQQEPAIQIFYGTNDQEEFSNATTINVTDTDSLLLLRFVGDTSIHDMTSDTSNMITSYRDVIKQGPPNSARVTDIHLLKVTGSGQMTVTGLRYLHETYNDYKIVLYFDVQREPPTTTTTTMTTKEDTATTQVTMTDGETTSDAVPTLLPAVQIEGSTLVSVGVVVIVIALVLCSVVIVAVAMAIHYRNRLKDLQQQRANDSTSQTA